MYNCSIVVLFEFIECVMTKSDDYSNYRTVLCSSIWNIQSLMIKTTCEGRILPTFCFKSSTIALKALSNLVIKNWIVLKNGLEIMYSQKYWEIFIVYKSTIILASCIILGNSIVYRNDFFFSIFFKFLNNPVRSNWY